jgi:hypothetical protein
MKLFKKILKIIIKIIVKFTVTQKSKSSVKINSWGGTSVDPSYVFRTERGRRDLDAISKMKIPNKVGRPNA